MTKPKHIGRTWANMPARRAGLAIALAATAVCLAAAPASEAAASRQLVLSPTAQGLPQVADFRDGDRWRFVIPTTRITAEVERVAGQWRYAAGPDQTGPDARVFYQSADRYVLGGPQADGDYSIGTDGSVYLLKAGAWRQLPEGARAPLGYGAYFVVHGRYTSEDLTRISVEQVSAQLRHILKSR